MIRFLSVLLLFCLIACSTKRIQKVSSNGLPLCLQQKITKMASDSNEASPISVTQYVYKGQLVYYVVSPCCDKFNVVYDASCNILGYPDGGYTGRGDGKMPYFKKEASDKKIIWQKDSAQ